MISSRALLLAALLAFALPLRAEDAEDAEANCAAVTSPLRAKLDHLQKEVAGLEAKLATAEDNDAAAKQAKASLDAAEARLKDVDVKLQAAEKRAAVLSKQLATAKAEADGCTTRGGELETAAKEAADKVAAALAAQKEAQGQLAGLKEELSRVHAEANVHRHALEELRAHHATAWLPHWLDESTRGAFAAVGPATERARGFWTAHGAPAVRQGVSYARAKGVELTAHVDSLLERSSVWSQVKAAAAQHWPRLCDAAAVGTAAIQKHTRAVWESRALAAVRPTLVAAATQVQAQAEIVVAELEVLLVGLLAKQQSTIALARKPYVTYIVCALLCVPLVAVGMPLLGLARSRRQASPASSGPVAPKSAQKKKKAVGKVQ